MNKTNLSSFSSTKRTDTDTETETETVTDTGTDTDTETVSHVKTGDINIKENTHTHSKKARGEFLNVLLSDEELTLLKKEYGESITQKAVELLSARIARDNRYANENHYATIKAWVISAVYEQESKRSTAEIEKDKMEEYRKRGFDFDFEDIYERP